METHERRHKAFVVVDDPTWLAFKGAVISQGLTIEGALGALVRNVVSQPGPMEQLPLTAPEKPSRGRTAPSRTRPTPKAKTNVRSSNKRSSRPTDR